MGRCARKSVRPGVDCYFGLESKNLGNMTQKIDKTDNGGFRAPWQRRAWLILACFAVFASAMPTSLQAATYYWQDDSGTSVAGFTTDSTGCGNNERDIFIITLMSAGGFNCTDFRHEVRDPPPQLMWLIINDTVYAGATEVTGIDFALDFLDDDGGGVTTRYELGYAQGGVFTSWGFVDEGPHEPEALYVTDLSSINGVAPAGSHLALRISDVDPSDGDMRMFLGSDKSSGVLNVFESTDCPGGIITTTVDSVAGSSLRACIIRANGKAGADTLTIPAGTYTLTIAGTGENAAATGDLDITDNLTLNGDAASATIIDGGGIDRVFEILGAAVTASNLTISNGDVTGDGGGIALDGTASLTLSDSTVSGNTSNDDGGGIYLVGAGGTVALTNVTLSGNTAGVGGGLFCQGPCTLTNVTITDNTASSSGGGLRQRTGGGTITFLNTIVANNSAPADVDCNGSAANLISNGYNISSDASCDFTNTGDQENTDPLLGPLQDNGGPTFTHELLTGSPAIDTGTNTGCPATDQRGTTRPIGGTCDIGAYEAPFLLTLIKTAFETDGTPIPTGSIIPSPVVFKYLLYINHTGVATSDVSVRDVLDAAFQYQAGTIQVDNSVAECALTVCTAAEELAIFTAVDGAAFLSDAVDGDVASITGSTIDAGNQNVANLQLNISADAVWAILFSVKMP